MHYFVHQTKWTSLDLTQKAKIAEVLLGSDAEPRRKDPFI